MEQRRAHKIIRGTQLSFVLEAFLKFLVLSITTPLIC